MTRGRQKEKHRSWFLFPGLHRYFAFNRYWIKYRNRARRRHDSPYCLLMSQPCILLLWTRSCFSMPFFSNPEILKSSAAYWQSFSKKGRKQPYSRREQVQVTFRKCVLEPLVYFKCNPIQSPFSVLYQDIYLQRHLVCESQIYWGIEMVATRSSTVTVNRISGANSKFTDENKVSGSVNAGKTSSTRECPKHWNLIITVKFL